MPELSTWLSVAVWAVPGTLVALWLLRRAGLLSARSLEHAPGRDLPVMPIDLLTAMFAMLAGSLLASAALSPWLASGGEAGEGHGARTAAARLAAQVLSLGPMAAVLVFRAMQADAGWRRSGLLPRRPGRDATWAAWSVLALIPVVTTLSAVVALIAALLGVETPAVAHTALHDMRREASVLALLLMIASAVVVAPLLEEVVFRGLLQSVLLKMLGPARRWSVIVIASAVFMSIHLGAGSWQALPAIFLVGCVWGWLYEKTGSLWPAILSHAGFNAYNIAVALLIVPPDA